MIFADRFAYVHAPKTGGTFVTAVLERIYGAEAALKTPRWYTRWPFRHKDRVIHHPRHGRYVYHKNKHGTCREMPCAERRKPILATVRNPYDWYVSRDEFGWWKAPVAPPGRGSAPRSFFVSMPVAPDERCASWTSGGSPPAHTVQTCSTSASSIRNV